MSLIINAKRKICLVMSLILFFGIIDTSSISAASANIFDVVFNKSMIEGTSNLTPVEGTPSLNSEQAYMDWDFNEVNGTAFSVGTFELTFPVADDTFAKLVVNKLNDNEAEVKYNILKSGADVAATSENTYLVHTNINSNDKPNYITIDKFLATANPLPDDMSARVLDNTPKSPYFMIKPSTGISFKYYNKTVHLKWDNGKFVFVTDGISKGNFYDLDFKFINVDGTITTDTKKITSGISEKTFNSIPIANDNNIVSKYITNELDLISNPAYDKNDLILDSTLVASEQPGTDEVKLMLRFDLPKVYDKTLNKFVTMQPGSLPDTYPLFIRLNSPIEGFSKVIKISDILKNGLSASDVTASGREGVIESAKHVDRNNDGNIDGVEVVIGSLKPSILYNSVNIEFEQRPDLVSNYTTLPKDKVFTFLDYKIIYENGRYFAQIKPYKGFNGYYKLQDVEDQNSSIIKSSDGSTELRFPLSITSEDAFARYQIFFSLEKPFDADGNNKDKIYSQIVNFSIKDLEESIGVPNNFHIEDDYKLYPVDDENTDVAKLDMTAVWNIAPVSVIDNMLAKASPTNFVELKYDLSGSLTPDAAGTSVISKVTIKIIDDNGVKKAYYSCTDTNGVITNAGPVPLRTGIDSETGKEVYIASVDYLMDAVQKQSGLTTPPTYFKYPNIYFLNVKLTEVNGKPQSSTASLFDSITLDDLSKQEIVPPQNLTTDNPITLSVSAGDAKDEVSFEVKYDLPSKKIKDYFDNINRTGFTNFDDVEISTNIYITAKEEKLKDNGKNVTPIIIDFNKINKNGRVYFSEINNTGIDWSAVMAGTNYKTPLEALRAGEVLKLENIKLTPAERDAVINGDAKLEDFIFDGMDKNQRYYLATDLKITHKNPAGATVVKNSNFSNLSSVLTKADKEKPGENEKIPVAPNLNKKDEEQDKVTLYWDKIPSKDDAGNDELVEYEIIRLTSEEMAASLLDSRIEFGNFYNGTYLPSTEKKGYRTNGDIVEVFNGTSYVPLDPSLYTYDAKTGVINFTDKTLKPNNLYFYYVRTVRITKTGERVVSVWSHLSVTTKPVKNPINLQITEALKYEPKTEFVIEFDAPLVDLSTLGTEVFLEYSLKEDSGDFGTPVRMDSSLLKTNSSAASDKDFTHFIYKITGLKHSTTYFIKVRLVDKNGDASLYSNTATTRTEMDQEDYENNQETNDWLNHFEQMLQKILKKYYWTASDTSSLFEVVFRPSMFDAYIAENNNGGLVLPTSKASEKIYYFPASSLVKLNDADLGFKISQDGIDVVVSKDAVDHYTNEIIKTVLADIKKDKAKDYFLKVRVKTSESKAKVEGNDPISPSVDLEFSIVTSSTLIDTFDKDLFTEFSKRVVEETSNSSLNTKIKEMVTNNSPNEEILAMLEDIVKTVNSDFTKKVTSRLNLVSKDIYKINNLNKPVYIVYTGALEDKSVSAFASTKGIWEPIEVENYGMNKAIKILKSGIYIFTGYVIDIPGLDEIQGADDLKALIIKYNLMDFIGKDVTSLSEPIDKASTFGIAARILGAQKGSDPVKFLKEKGINVNARNPEANLNVQDGINLFMNVYSVRKNIKIESIKISNFNLTKNIQGIDDKNKVSVRAAFETGIFSDTKMNPNAATKIEDVLKMLKQMGV